MTDITNPLYQFGCLLSLKQMLLPSICQCTHTHHNNIPLKRFSITLKCHYSFQYISYNSSIHLKKITEQPLFLMRTFFLLYISFYFFSVNSKSYSIIFIDIQSINFNCHKLSVFVSPEKLRQFHWEVKRWNNSYLDLFLYKGFLDHVEKKCSPTFSPERK